MARAVPQCTRWCLGLSQHGCCASLCLSLRMSLQLGPNDRFRDTFKSTVYGSTVKRIWSTYFTREAVRTSWHERVLASGLFL